MKKWLLKALSIVLVLGMLMIPAAAVEGEEAAPAPLTFTDADSVKNAEEVAKLVEMGVVSGFEDGSFKPQDKITREAMAKMAALVISQAAGETIPEKKTSKFADVGERWSAMYVDYCADKGVINGRSDSVFDYASTITVTEAAKVLLAWVGFTGLTGSDWATQTYNAASLVGLLNGVETPNNDPVTRDEAALMICTAMELKNDETVASVIENFSGGLGAGMPGGMPEGGMPDGGGMEAPPPAPPGGGGPVSFSFSDAVTSLESKTYDDVAFPDSTNGPENAVQAKGGVEAVLNNPTVVKSAGNSGGDASSFYGTNAAVMAGGMAKLDINGGTVTTSAMGANGVFSYGAAVVTVKDLVVRTTLSGSGGIMAAGGGTLYAYNCDVETQGGSSAAIRSDRGGGTMFIDGGRYVAHGGGSPAVYVTADITVKNSYLEATMAQGVVIEGKNSVTIENCELTGNVAAEGTTASDDDEKSNIMVMQSMSGDAAIGTAKFTMIGGKLTANSGNMFYTTNTSSEITISGVEITGANDVFLLCVCNENYRKWGTPGKNGANCLFTATNQKINGNIIYDTASTLDLKLLEGSAMEGSFQCRDWYTGEGGATVTVDGTSSITVTDTSVITTLVIEEGAKITASRMTVGGVDTPIAPGTYTDVVLYK